MPSEFANESSNVVHTLVCPSCPVCNEHQYFHIPFIAVLLILFIIFSAGLYFAYRLHLLGSSREDIRSSTRNFVDNLRSSYSSSASSATTVATPTFSTSYKPYARTLPLTSKNPLSHFSTNRLQV